MSKILQHRRGTTLEHSTFIGAEGEVTVDTDKNTLIVHDGITAGGHEIVNLAHAENTYAKKATTLAGYNITDAYTKTEIDALVAPLNTIKEWTVVSTPTTAANYDKLLVNTSSSSVVINLPSNPPVGATVTIADAAGTFGTNNCVISGNGQTIMNSNTDLLLDINNVKIVLIYNGNDWRVF